MPESQADLRLVGKGRITAGRIGLNRVSHQNGLTRLNMAWAKAVDLNSPWVGGLNQRVIDPAAVDSNSRPSR